MRVDGWDGPMAEPGDFLRTRTGRCYQIEEFRPSRPGSRSLGTLVCVRLDDDAVLSGEPGVHDWAWTPRVRRR